MNISPLSFVEELANLTGDGLISGWKLENIAQQFGMSGDLALMVFFGGLRDAVRSIPPKAFLTEDHRQVLMAAAQETYDKHLVEPDAT